MSCEERSDEHSVAGTVQPQVAADGPRGYAPGKPQVNAADAGRARVQSWNWRVGYDVALVRKVPRGSARGAYVLPRVRWPVLRPVTSPPGRLISASDLAASRPNKMLVRPLSRVG